MAVVPAQECRRGMITVAQQRLHALWHRPGAVMADGWWPHLSMHSWQQAYAGHAGVRPSLDVLIAERLGHQGAIPTLTPSAQLLLDDERRTETLCIALGLWALNCPDYLLLRPYRVALAETLGEATLAQLCALFPASADATASVEPLHLVATTHAAGGIWLGAADDRAVAATRLFCPPAEPSHFDVPKASPLPVLEKLRKWL